MGQFHRWKPINDHSLPYRVFIKFDNELFSLITSLESGKGYIFRHLTADGATYESDAFHYGLTQGGYALNVRNWADKYNYFRNWARLSLLMSCNSYMENYFACIIKEAIESNPGLLIATPRLVDGILYRKKDIHLHSDDVETIVTSCTKGVWSSRIAALKRLFGAVTPLLESNVASLDAIRKIRNDFGHAFGRDIEASKNYYNTTKSPMQNLTIERFNKYHTLIKKMVREFDIYVKGEHIGNYEELYQLSLIYNRIKDLAECTRAEHVKTALYNAGIRAKRGFCRDMVTYYEAL